MNSRHDQIGRALGDEELASIRGGSRPWIPARDEELEAGSPLAPDPGELRAEPVMPWLCGMDVTER